MILNRQFYFIRWLSDEEIRENRDIAYKSKKDQSATAAMKDKTDK